MRPSRPPARVLRALFSLAAIWIAFAVAPSAALAADCPGADSDPRADLALAERATVCLLNAERAAHGLPSVWPNQSLRKASEGHALDMVTRLFFGHIAPGGGLLIQRLLNAGYMLTGERWLAGETLAWGETSKARPREIVRSWMASPTHRAVILTPAFDEVGIAVVNGLPVKSILPGVTYAGEFAWRQPRLKVVPARFALAPRRTAVPARRSTQFRYMLSEPATVRLTIRRAMTGRLRGRACVRPTRALSRARRCVRQVLAGVVSGSGTTGQNAVRFGGWIGRRRLVPGSYRVTLTVTDLDDGHTAPETSARFTILPR
jgi:uncharacterized protein YkwD